MVMKLIMSDDFDKLWVGMLILPVKPMMINIWYANLFLCVDFISRAAADRLVTNCLCLLACLRLLFSLFMGETNKLQS